MSQHRLPLTGCAPTPLAHYLKALGILRLVEPLQGHAHTFIFCEPNGARDAITHVTVFAAMGFDATARRALEILTRSGVWGHGGHDLQLVLLGLGHAGTFADCTLFGPAKVWRSLTPFVATRHPKTHRDGRPKLDADGWWIGSPEHHLRRLLTEASRPLPVKLEPLETIPVGTRRLRPLEFQISRFHGEGRRGRHAAAAKAEVGAVAEGQRGEGDGLGLSDRIADQRAARRSVDRAGRAEH